MPGTGLAGPLMGIFPVGKVIGLHAGPSFSKAANSEGLPGITGAPSGHRTQKFIPLLKFPPFQICDESELPKGSSKLRIFLG